MLLEKFRCRCTDKSLDRIVFIKHCSSLLEMDWCSLYVSTGLCWQVHIFWGEGNGTPLQYSCLENPMDGGAWLQSMGLLRESDTTERLHFHFLLSCIGEGNGKPLQCSCLENPRDRGAWWAAVCGVTESWTRLKRLSSSSGSISFYNICIKQLYALCTLQEYQI